MRRIDSVRDLVVPPISQESADMVLNLLRQLENTETTVTITVDGPDADNRPALSVQLPAAVVAPLTELLTAMVDGQSVAVMPSSRELSTAEAAQLLNVSRPFVVKEMEEGRLPHRKVGSHRRVAVDDVMVYRAQMRARQEGALERMADNARELGLEY